MESGHLIKIDVCLWSAITTPWKKMVKFGTSFDDRSFQTGASHMKDHGFPKGDVSIQTPVAGDFIVWPHKNFHATQSPLYHGFDFLAHFRYRYLYLRYFLRLTCILCIKIKLQPELHVLLKGMRIAIWSGSIQWCRRTIRGVWVLADQNARLRSHA